MKRHGGTKKGAGKDCFGNRKPKHFNSVWVEWLTGIDKKESGAKPLRNTRGRKGDTYEQI
jgi:hypothetical protein